MEIVADLRSDDPGWDSALLRIVDLDDLPATASLDQILARIPGALTSRSGSVEDWLSVSVRGASSRQVRVLLDGQALELSGSRSVDLSRFPAGLLQRIEVLPAGQGSGAAATINLITRSTHALNLELGGASFGTGWVLGSGTGPRWQASVLARTARGDHPWYDDNGTRYTPEDDSLDRRKNNDGRSLAVRFGLGNARTPAQAHLSYEHRERGLPGPTGSRPGSTRMDRRYLNTDGRGTVLEGSALSLSIGGALSYERTAVRDPDGALFLKAVDFLEHRQSGEGRAQLDLDLGSNLLQAKLTMGWDAWQDARALEPTSASRPRLALELTDRIDLWPSHGDRLLLHPSASLLLTNHRGLVPVLQAQGVDPEGASAGFLAPISAGLHLSWKAIEAGPSALWFLATARTGSRVPDLAELMGNQGLTRGNPKLLPERGGQAELSLKLRAQAPLPAGSGRKTKPQPTLDLDLTGFASRYENSIVWIQTPQRIGYPVNLAASRVLGGELSAQLQVGPLGGGLALTLQSPRNLDPRDPRPRNIPGQAWISATGWLDLRLPYLDLNLTAEHRGATFHDLANLDPSPARTFLNLAATLRFHPQVALALQVSNLTDQISGTVPLNPADPSDPRTRRVPVDDRAGFPLPGRSLRVSMTFRPLVHGQGSSVNTPHLHKESQ